MHQAVLDEVKKFKVKQLPAGTRLYHGCYEGSLYTDRPSGLLAGSRKWFSQSAKLAVSYGYDKNKTEGRPLLWVCKLTVDVPCLEGRQGSLESLWPSWEIFPSAFPNAFEEYAKSVLPGSGSRALLDHFIDGIYREILLTAPQSAVVVVDTIELPPIKADAEALALQRFNC